MAKGIALALLCFLLAACASPPGSLCTAGPILLDPADRLTRGTLVQILTLNRAGARICGWRPKGEIAEADKTGVTEGGLGAGGLAPEADEITAQFREGDGRAESVGQLLLPERMAEVAMRVQAVKPDIVVAAVLDQNHATALAWNVKRTSSKKERPSRQKYQPP